MSIAHYIQQEVLLPRARDARVLVVYDESQRYHELCLGLNTEELHVVDAMTASRAEMLRCRAWAVLDARHC